MTTKFLAYIVIGWVLVFLGMKFPLFSESRVSFVKRLWTCSLCAGTWCYIFLSFVMGEVLFRDIFYVPIVSEMATGGIVAIVAHLVEQGWKSKFEVISIE